MIRAAVPYQDRAGDVDFVPDLTSSSPARTRAGVDGGRADPAAGSSPAESVDDAAAFAAEEWRETVGVSRVGDAAAFAAEESETVRQ